MYKNITKIAVKGIALAMGIAIHRDEHTQDIEQRHSRFHAWHRTHSAGARKFSRISRLS